MTLRSKLVISFTALLLVVIAAVGVVASSSLEQILTDQVDRVLRGITDRGPGGTPPEPINEPATGTGQREGALRRDTAEILISLDGTVVFERPSGFRDDPDPLPDTSELPPDAAPVTIPAVDGSLSYRASVIRLPDGATLLLAVPLTGVADAVSSLINALLLAGAGVLLVGGAATWWTVKRSMDPVEQMVDTAESIAAGDLTQRVQPLNPRTELGRLSSSLNTMLTHIEDAVELEREGQERLRQFVGDASHELRTPVTAIAGYAELRRKGALDSSEAEDKAWSRIEAESSRMRRLIEDLLMLARLGQSHPLDLKQVDLVEIARDAAADHAAIDVERPVALSGAGSAGLTGDQHRLHQVVSSLLANARMHTPPGTQIEITVTDKGDTVELAVADSGPGIPAEALDDIFERFYRADASRSRSSGGSGLGLSIVRAIVAAHGGLVRAGNGTGGGATITVTLPTDGPDTHS